MKKIRPFFLHCQNSFIFSWAGTLYSCIAALGDLGGLPLSYLPLNKKNSLVSSPVPSG